MSSYCEIFLNNSVHFHSNGSIEGKLVCNFTELKKIKDIIVRLYGKEHTQLLGDSTTKDDVEEKKNNNFNNSLSSGSNILVSLETVLFGSRDNVSSIGPGIFTYPFNIPLPSKNLPSTYKNQYGSISYMIEGIVNNFRSPNYRHNLNFNLINPINLNNLPFESFQRVSKIEINKKCCFFFLNSILRSNNMSMTMELDKTAFALGEKIKMMVTLKNNVNKKIESLKVELIQLVKTHYDNPRYKSRSVMDTLSISTFPGVDSYNEKKYEIYVEIPPDLELPNFENSKLFEVDHDLRVTAEISGCVSDLDVDISVTLGHIERKIEEVSTEVFSSATISGKEESNFSPSAPRFSQLEELTNGKHFSE